ncbi:MAG: nitrite reductase small subunit NirD [Cytophagales bacterium]|nr:nitrite reductase small subunit NirD [Cytophagales bacterium]
MTEIAEKVGWMKVCHQDDIPKDGGACVLVNGLQIAIFHFARRNEWYATQNMCPHKQQMVLSRGMIGSHGNEPKVACPFHKKTFSLRSGQCLSGEEYTIKTYKIKNSEGTIYILVD